MAKQKDDKPALDPGMLHAAQSPLGGRGVFAGRDIPADTIIEVAPVIILHGVDAALAKQTALHNYFFRWGDSQETIAICLGLGSLYNHSDTPNVVYVRDFQAETIRFRTLRRISQGEELLTDYHGGRRRSDRYAFEKTTSNKNYRSEPTTWHTDEPNTG